jgi:1,2-diacylglycerol 3-beta-glucosyltransferase
VAGLVIVIAMVLVGGLVAAASLYLVLLAVAAFFYRDRVPVSPARSRLAVLVPAHNEAELIGRCLDSLAHQSYPNDLYDIVVIADNCTDGTVTIAAAHGAQVLVRDQPDARGKGQALRWAMDQLLRDRPDLDAVIVVDADSFAAPHLVAALARQLEAGADVVQGEYLVLQEDHAARSELKAAGLLLFHRVRFSGRAALGLPCHLVGNGMLFSRRLLEERPWNAFTSAEDLEYSVDLRLAGIRPVFASDGGVRGPMPARGRAARTQRLRWEGGRFHVVRSRLPQLIARVVRHRDWSLVDAAVDLAVPPLGLLTLVVVLGMALSTALAVLGRVPLWATIPWIVASVAVPSFVLLGLSAGRAPASAYRALILAPLFIGSALVTRLRLIGGLRATTWERTERPSDTRDSISNDDRDDRVEPPPPGRPQIGGVPIDPVDLDEAISRTMSAVQTHSFMQICTVNLDFLVNSRRDRVVRNVLQDSHLNLADGAPVVWLGRLLGCRLRQRVAGSDFVPALMAMAEQKGARVFFLGGEDGAASLAAEKLVARHSNLVIAGVYEPPRASLDKMDNTEILDILDRAQVDILLVALGHPKQDKWIHRMRDQLPVSVAVGVGCTFDLMAGHRRRAPSWMQQHGLEWLYRLAHEPRRLCVRYATDAWWLVAVLFPITLRYRLLSRQ